MAASAARFSCSSAQRRAPAPAQLRRGRAAAWGAVRLAGAAPRRALRLPRAAAGGSDGGGWAVEYLVDLECPLRRAEVDSLRRLDRNRRISFVDISERAYAPEQHGDIAYEDAMRAPAARLADGTIVRSAEVYGALYEAAGLGVVWQLTRLPGVRVVVDAVFDFWTRQRLPLTGRGSLEKVMRARQAELER